MALILGDTTGTAEARPDGLIHVELRSGGRSAWRPFGNEVERRRGDADEQGHAERLARLLARRLS